MKALLKSQTLRFTERAINQARRAVPRYSSKFSKHRYTLPHHVVLLCLNVRKDMTSRGLLDDLIEMPRIRRVLGLAELPTPSTLGKAFNQLDICTSCHIDSFSFLLASRVILGLNRFKDVPVTEICIVQKRSCGHVSELPHDVEITDGSSRVHPEDKIRR